MKAEPGAMSSVDAHHGDNAVPEPGAMSSVDAHHAANAFTDTTDAPGVWGSVHLSGGAHPAAKLPYSVAFATIHAPGLFVRKRLRQKTTVPHYGVQFAPTPARNC